MRSWIFLMLMLATSVVSFSQGSGKWRRVLDLEGRWFFSIGDNQKWADPTFSHQGWEKIWVPAKWEDEGFNGYDGYAWYRTTFNGAMLKDRQQSYTLMLGYIDDVDEVYLNGVKVGMSGSFPPKYHTAVHSLRAYNIPSNAIRFDGTNVIAVRVYDAGIEGGIVKGNVGIYIDEEAAAFAVNLKGLWDFSPEQKRYGSGRVSVQSNRVPSQTLSWTTINVPAPWEHQGFSDFDGTAWYRKQFFVPKHLDGEDLLLILGKIDDYDETYLNGKRVGFTEHYDKLRIYHLSPDMYTAGALNLLLIYVSDHGGQGGIYEGPVGLMKQSQFTKFMRWR